MTNQEVNKIIAEFMGFETYGDGMYIADNADDKEYTDSLDALVPVWEKRNEYSKAWAKQTRMLGIWSHWHRLIMKEILLNPELSYIEAAAHATAKAILELNKG